MITRRKFLAAGLISGSALLGWGGWNRIRNGVADARDFGVRTSTLQDQTEAVQRFIDAAADEGVVAALPEGVYYIDALVSLRLPSGLILRMTPSTILQALPNDATHYSVLRVEDQSEVRIAGGSIRGERTRHTDRGGEWGMGISVLGSADVIIEDLAVSDCWGDGIYIGSTPAAGESRHVIVRNCIADNNRRQGLSIVACLGASVSDSSFTRTNGTGPASGIDLEPNAPHAVRNVEILRCRVEQNEGRGIKLDGGRGALELNTLRENTVRRNRLSGIEVANSAHGNLVVDNVSTGNGRHGIQVNLNASGNQIIRNTSIGNSTSADGEWDNIFVGDNADYNLIALNVCGRGPSALGGPGYAITIASPDCSYNRIVDNDTGGRPESIRDRGTHTDIVR